MMYLGRICSQQKLLNLPWQQLRAGATCPGLAGGNYFRTM